MEQVKEFMAGPYGQPVLIGVGVLLLLALLLWRLIKRFRQGKKRWEEARSSARGMQLGMQANATSGEDDRQ